MGQSVDERDSSLVARANRGDADALEALYSDHRDWVTALAYRFTGSRDDALDVLQETFLYVFGKFPGFRLSSTMRSFLYPVVKHKSISVLRRRKKLVDLQAFREGRPQDDLVWQPSEPGGLGLNRLVAELPEGHREVVWLRFGLDFRLEEIAQALEIPLGTVKSRLHNALKLLRSSVGEARSLDPDKKTGAGL